MFPVVVAVQFQNTSRPRPAQGLYALSDMPAVLKAKVPVPLMAVGLVQSSVCALAARTKRLAAKAIEKICFIKGDSK